MILKQSILDISQLKMTINGAISAICPYVNNDINRATELLFVPIPRAHGATAFQMIRKGHATKAVEMIREILLTNQRKNALLLKNMDAQRQKLEQL